MNLLWVILKESKFVWLFVIAFYSILTLLIIWARSRSFEFTPFGCWNKCNGIGWRALKNTHSMCLCNMFCVSFIRSFVRSTLILFVCYTLLDRVCICIVLVFVWCWVSVSACVLVYMSEATTIHRNILHLYHIKLVFWVLLFVFRFLMNTYTHSYRYFSITSACILLLVWVFFQFECSFHASMYVRACVTLACICVLQFG